MSTIQKRLEAKLRGPDVNGCYSWTGAVSSVGYGVIRNDGGSKLLLVHRVSYELSKGPIKPGLTIDHLCRNRLCANPNHLEAVTNRVNNLRGGSSAARNARKTHCKRGHELIDPNLVRVSGRPVRRCRLCANATNRASRKRKAEAS